VNLDSRGEGYSVMAKRVKVNGVWLDSQAEAGRYIQLLIEEREGKISDLKVHISWPLVAHVVYDYDRFEDIGMYTADFTYIRNDDEIVEDVKGQVPKKKRNGSWSTPRGWSEFRLRCRILEANYGVEVEVVANTGNYLTRIYQNRKLFQGKLKGIDLS